MGGGGGGGGSLHWVKIFPKLFSDTGKMTELGGENGRRNRRSKKTCIPYRGGQNYISIYTVKWWLKAEIFSQVRITAEELSLSKLCLACHQNWTFPGSILFLVSGDTFPFSAVLTGLTAPHKKNWIGQEKGLMLPSRFSVNGVVCFLFFSMQTAFKVRRLPTSCKNTQHTRSCLLNAVWYSLVQLGLALFLHSCFHSLSPYIYQAFAKQISLVFHH